VSGSSRRVAVVGVGETDYRLDWERAREAERAGRQLVDDPESYGYELAVTAFRRALADSGLGKADVDGLAVHPMPGLTFERVAELLGLSLTWGGEEGHADNLIQLAVEAISGGRCETVAVVYGQCNRTAGMTTLGGVQPRLYYMNLWYYHPWGFSGGTAQYAMTYQQYLNRFGKDEAAIAAVPIAFRANAMLNDNAVMREPLTIDDYLESRYICRPLRVYDCSLFNDGGACVILRRADLAHDLPQTPVLVAGLGRHGSYRHHTQLRFRMLDDCWENIRRSGRQCFEMARLGPDDIDVVQCHDGYSVHVPLNLEGFGFCEPGEGLDFVQDGRIGIGGDLPCNTSGGLLSESFMHGMNLHIEAVRQLRHEAGNRQVAEARTAMYCHHGHWGAVSVLYERG
jgi:acetyl-CoA acetyltransferase